MFRLSAVPRAAIARASMVASADMKSKMPRVQQQMMANFARAISTSTPRTEAKAENANAVAAAEEPKTLTDYVNKFGGWYPLAGLGGFIAVSKELLVLNEELLMVTNFAAFVFFSWLALGDKVTEYVKESQDAETKENDQCSDLYITSIEHVVKALENQQAIIPLLESLKTEYSALNTQAGTAKQMRARQLARETAVQRLNAIYAREQDIKTTEMAGLFDTAYTKVVADLNSMSEKEKSAIIDYSIDVISGKAGKMTEANDPVGRLYKKYLFNKK